MVSRNSTFRLLLLAGVISIAGIIFMGNSLRGPAQFVPGQTTYVHPPATQDREAASAALDELGWTGESGEGQALFVPALQSGESMAIETRLSHSVVPRGEGSTVFAAVAVRAGEPSRTERSSLNLSLVIDRSGSMTGAKMGNARQAAHELIDALGPEDTLSIVAYATDVEVVAQPGFITDDVRAELHAAVDRIHPEGGTNLSGGYEAGRDLVVSQAKSDQINRVLLLSDGRANEGVVELSELGALASDGLERGVSLTTLGVGYDYNEDLMQLMATTGVGNYYFIADEEQTEETFDRELKGLMSTVARNTELRFRLPEGARIIDVHGFEFSRKDDLVTVRMDAFFADQQKDLLVELEVDSTDRETFELLKTQLVYDDVATAEHVKVKRSSVVRTGHAEKSDPVILRRVQQIRTASAFDEAMVLYDAGDRYAASERITQQREANKRFVSRYDILDPAFDRVDRELGALAEALTRTERHSTKGKWISKSAKFRSGSMMYNSGSF